MKPGKKKKEMKEEQISKATTKKKKLKKKQKHPGSEFIPRDEETCGVEKTKEE